MMYIISKIIFYILIIPSKISNLKELIKVLNSLRYWMVNELPYFVFSFVMRQKDINFSDFYDFKLVEQLSLIIDVKSDPKKRLIDEAARHGYLNLLKFLAKKHKMTKITAQAATESCDTECLKFLIENNCPTIHYLHDYAIFHNNLECVKYLHHKGLIQKDFQVCTFAELKSKTKILKYFLSNNFRWTSPNMKLAITKDDVELLKLAIKYGASVSEQDLCYIAANDSIRCLTYFITNGYFDDVTKKELVKKIIINCAVKCMRYMFESGYAPDINIYLGITGAYKSVEKQLTMLKYIHENKCVLPGSSDEEFNEFINKNIYILQYLFDNVKTKIELLKYMKETICPDNEIWLSYAYLSLIGHSSEKEKLSFEYLYENESEMNIQIIDHIYLSKNQLSIK